MIAVVVDEIDIVQIQTGRGGSQSDEPNNEKDEQSGFGGEFRFQWMKHHVIAVERHSNQRINGHINRKDLHERGQFTEEMW